MRPGRFNRPIYSHKAYPWVVGQGAGAVVARDENTELLVGLRRDRCAGQPEQGLDQVPVLS